MEAAHRHRQAGLEELAGEIDGARELVGLHADQADQRLAAAALDVGDDAVGADPRIGLVERLDDDVDVRPQTPRRAAILTQAIERGQGVGRDMGAQPGDRIAVVVVVRRLDQHELEDRTSCTAPPIADFLPTESRVRLGRLLCHRLTAYSGHNALRKSLQRNCGKELL